MSMKGKIYAKYLQRAKYVVKGRKLKSPIATIRKRVMPVQSVNANVIQNGVAQNNAMQNAVMQGQNTMNNPQLNKKANVVNSNDVVNKKAPKENDISFSELGKKIVDGEDKDKKNDSKTLMFATVALAIIIIVGVVKIGSLVYSEITPSTKVAKEETEEVPKNDELADFLLGDGEVQLDPELQPTNEEVEEILNEVLEAEGTDINSITDEEKKEKLEEIKQVMVNTDTSSTTNKQAYLDDIKDKLTNPTTNPEVDNGNNGNGNNGNNGNGSDEDKKEDPEPDTNKDPEPKPTVAPNPNPKPGDGNPTAGDGDKKDYVTIGSSSGAFSLYHVSKSSILTSDVSSYSYTKYKTDGDDIKVPSSDVGGMWFIDNGSGIAPLKGNVHKVTLKEKNEGEYVSEATYYVISGGTLSLNGSYVTSQDAEGDGSSSFTVNSDMTLYKK